MNPQMKKLKLRRRREHNGMPSHVGQSHPRSRSYTVQDGLLLRMLAWATGRRLAQAQRKGE